MLPPVRPLSSEIGVCLPRVQLLVFFKKAGNRESLPARVARPGLFAGVRPFVDVQMGGELVGFPADVAAEGSLVGV